MNSIIDNPNLATQGSKRMRWFIEQMNLMTKLKSEFEIEKPFLGLSIAICLHVEPKTAYWIETLLSGGASHIWLVGCLGTTKPDTAAYLASNPNITILAKENDTLDDHYGYLEVVMQEKPDLLLDNGASLILAYCRKERDWKPIGANEETRTGRLLIDDSGYDIPFPVIVIDDSPLKRLLENATGVGQSVIDGFMRSTSTLIGGRTVLIIGYGWVGNGIANKFRALGAQTLVFDKDPVYLLKAKVDGHKVDEDLENLIPIADVIITATGRFHIIRKTHIPLFKQKAILCNAGHFGFEIDTNELREQADLVEVLPGQKEILHYGDKEVFLLENANPLNLSAGDGNPIEIMDLGLGLQALSAKRHVKDQSQLHNGVQAVPKDINNTICHIMLNLNI